MSLQIYYVKKNPDILKVERYCKERKLPYQLIDLNKHKLGKREMELFASVAGAKVLVDRSNKKALERPVAHMDSESLIIEALLDNPKALISPILRNGRKILIDMSLFPKWMEENA